jgi:bifunctional UDP-N-acetylglucosamine pyrophosphorylase / glucosamine-1-phosphate N-acetyltransferase
MLNGYEGFCMSKPPVAAIVLAAGKGTRMKSGMHKVLHKIAGQSMIAHLLDSVTSFSPERIVLVVGAQREQLQAAVPDVSFAVQDPQYGTGHAVQCAEAELNGFKGDILILYGDVPLLRAQSLEKMIAALHSPVEGVEPVACVMTFTPIDAGAYGRVETDHRGVITKMVEFKDANDKERALETCNSGIMAVRSEHLFRLLAKVTNDNAQSEYYLPDIIKIAASEDLISVTVHTLESEVAGVNSRADLANVENQWQQQRRAEAMAAGVTLVDPSSVWFSFDTQLGQDVIIEPNVFFGPSVVVADGVMIRGFSHLEGCTIGKGAEIGPFARLRPGTQLGEKTKIGNFVEIKKSVLSAGAKVNHLSYIGDATIGEKANIGAGTITCNYDGFFKYKTEIGAGAFIGSNSSLVAPVSIGAGAIIGAGSVVTKPAGSDALVVTRADQREIPGWAGNFRIRQNAKKTQK